MNAAELLRTLRILAGKGVDLERVTVKLYQGHPDYIGPDVIGKLEMWSLNGWTLALATDDAKEFQDG